MILPPVPPNLVNRLANFIRQDTECQEFASAYAMASTHGRGEAGDPNGHHIGYANAFSRIAASVTTRLRP